MSGDREVSPAAGGVRLRVSRWLARILRFVAAGLLATAGGAKLADGLFSNAFSLADEGVVYILIGSAELVVGLWLLTFWRSERSLQVALCLFAVFTGFSAYRFWEGWPECGCFGTLFPTKTATMLVVDVMMMAGLFWATHRTTPDAVPRQATTGMRQAK